MIIAGIDYSYVSPAICIYDTNKELKFENLKLYNANRINLKLAGNYGNIIVSRFPDYKTEYERYRNVCKWATDILSENKVEEVCIEGYSFGASAGLVFNIAENGGLLKQYLDLASIPFIVPAPTEVKRQFTGGGRAKKEDMIDEFNRFFNVKIHDIMGVKEYSKPTDDLCDSAAIMLMHYSFPKRKIDEPKKSKSTKLSKTTTT